MENVHLVVHTERKGKRTGRIRSPLVISTGLSAEEEQGERHGKRKVVWHLGEVEYDEGKIASAMRSCIQWQSGLRERKKGEMKRGIKRRVTAERRSEKQQVNGEKREKSNAQKSTHGGGGHRDTLYAEVTRNYGT